MKRILLTGGNGFLVRNILPYLRDYDVATLSQHGNHTYLCDLAHNEPCFSEQFDIVFHAAGKAHSVPANEAERQVFFDVNVNGTKNLCKALEKSGLPQQFIYISTVAVYGVESGIGITENAPCVGQTPYALSKLETERFLIQWCNQHDIKLAILRPALISGEDAPGNLGAMSRGIRNYRYASIGGGVAHKSIILAEDFASLIPLLSSIKFGVYNVCADYAPSFREIEQVMAKHYNRPILSIPIGLIKPLAKLGDILGPNSAFNTLKLKKITSSLTFSNEKIKSETGWQPKEVIQNLKF